MRISLALCYNNLTFLQLCSRWHRVLQKQKEERLKARFSSTMHIETTRATLYINSKHRLDAACAFNYLLCVGKCLIHLLWGHLQWSGGIPTLFAQKSLRFHLTLTTLDSAAAKRHCVCQSVRWSVSLRMVAVSTDKRALCM